MGQVDAAPLDPITRHAPRLAGRAVLQQVWSLATFLHWRIEPERVAPLLPPGTRPDEYDGSSWVGLIGFHLGRAQFLPLPPVPIAGDFAEVNVRLYSVDADGRRGVVFSSLDAASLPAVLAARALYGLRYFWARADIARTGDEVRVRSRRRSRDAPHCDLTVRPSGEPVVGDPMADFLTARWGLHAPSRAARGARSVYLPNEHEPWPLERATAAHVDESLLAAAGLPGVSSRPPDSVLYASRVTTRFGRGIRLD